METRHFNTVVVGGGQAGVAASTHLKSLGVDHVVLERSRIAEAWRTSRWDSLVANGPAWHDRFPIKEFGDTAPDDFATKESCATYFEELVGEQDLPVRTGVEVVRARRDGAKYLIETSEGRYFADNMVVATGPFQVPLTPPLVPADAPVIQMHSHSYKSPSQIAEGGVLVVGAGSSGAQIADELLRDGRDVYLSIGPHDRPPRRYRGHDFCYWLGVMGKWEIETPPEGREHVTISVSGAHGGETVDFCKLAERGMNLLGMAGEYIDGKLTFRDDLATNIRNGDENLISLLDEADEYIARKGLDYPEEPEAKIISPTPECVKNPMLELDLKAKGIKTILWATGYRQDFSWIDVDAFDAKGAPIHRKGIAKKEGLYFLGLPWLSMRGSSFIWGVWVDAERVAKHIAAR